MEPCLRFGLIVSFLQLQDAATRTPSLPAGWWILNGNREKNKKSYANIILLLCFFFQGNRIAFNTLLLQWSSYQLPGHLTRLVPKALAVAENVDRSFTSATSRMFAATKNGTENIALLVQHGDPHHAAGKETPHWDPNQTLETAKWIEMVQKWLEIASSASGSLVRWCCWKNHFRTKVHIKFDKIKIIISNTLGTRPRSSGA